MSFLLFFTPYVNKFEWKVARFMKSIRETSTRQQIEGKLINLMQENLVIVSVWLEKKYKNYRYLKKRKRKKLYQNLEKIKTNFFDYSAQFNLNPEFIKQELASLSLRFQAEDMEKLIYLRKLMQFLRPGGLYQYEAGASFGRLLSDPEKEKLIGDCNQMVTFYAYFYSLKFNISELQIKILPKHVCLHLNGVDLEATNGSFQNYKDYEHILPITEIVSTNLLDVSDASVKQAAISANSLLEASKLAYVISSMRDLVTKNLKSAYQNAGINAMKNNSFDKAIYFFQQISNQELIKSVYHNGAIYFAKNNNFNKANYYASQTTNEDLKKSIKEQEGFYYFKKNSFDKARSIFSQLGNSKMVEGCYKQELYLLSQKVKNIKTVQEAKAHRSTYNKMANLAEKAGMYENARQYRDIIGKM